MKAKKQEYLVSPIDAKNVTKGKKYKILSKGEYGAYVILDNEKEEYCLYGMECAHLDSEHKWKLIK